MRAFLSYLIAPIGGILAFLTVWSVPLLPYADNGLHFFGQAWSLAATIVVPAFVLVLTLSLGVMFGVRARFGGAWWAAMGGGLLLYSAAFALLAVRFGFGAMFADPFWVGGLVAGGLVHGLVFRAAVGPGRRPRSV
ncbi:hypothetical protein [Thiohalorhabdus sp.]|uniref:hypothetical protein n=1 Tax=Thiohalorhabdus sp. TaxID=3094134 RepID=UPI002FC31040